MHRPFVPVPGWLSAETNHTRRFVSDQNSIEFLLTCFKTLYSLGLSDRQTLELTALFIWLSDKAEFHVPLAEPCDGSKTGVPWYLFHSAFFLNAESLEQKIKAWMAWFLAKNDLRTVSVQSFWYETKNWFEFFVSKSDEIEKFQTLVVKTRNRFGQHCLGLVESGVWDRRSIEECKKFQNSFPKSLVPWKNGNLDGFTYKYLIRSWKKKNSC